MSSICALIDLTFHVRFPIISRFVVNGKHRLHARPQAINNTNVSIEELHGAIRDCYKKKSYSQNENTQSMYARSCVHFVCWSMESNYIDVPPPSTLKLESISSCIVNITLPCNRLRALMFVTFFLNFILILARHPWTKFTIPIWSMHFNSELSLFHIFACIHSNLYNDINWPRISISNYWTSLSNPQMAYQETWFT